MASTSFRGLKVPSSSPVLTAPLLRRCGSLPPHVALPETVNSSPLDFRTISASESRRHVPFHLSMDGCSEDTVSSAARGK